MSLSTLNAAARLLGRATPLNQPTSRNARTFDIYQYTDATVIAVATAVTAAMAVRIPQIGLAALEAPIGPMRIFYIPMNLLAALKIHIVSTRLTERGWT